LSHVFGAEVVAEVPIRRHLALALLAMSGFRRQLSRLKTSYTGGSGGGAGGANGSGAALGPPIVGDRANRQLSAEELDALLPAAQQPQAQVTYRSHFEGLWTDRVDAEQVIERRWRAGQLRAADVERLKHWVEHGYIVLPGAVPAEDCEAIKADLGRAFEHGDERLHVLKPGEHFGTPLQPGTPQARMRVNDIYVYYESARRALFAEPIVRFLRLIFSGSPTLLQSLTFDKGSQQGIHQDTAYVVIDPPGALAASWIALEDVQPGSGELVYYDGSHRLDDFLFSDRYKCWHHERDGAGQHDEYATTLVPRAEAAGLQRQRLLIKRGDVLVWSGNLAHGGGEVTDENLSRRSLVGHYCPEWAVPRYFDQFPERAVLRQYGGGRFASTHYDVRTGG
jgi:phytanoyl-CoA hydroxylase